MEQAFVKAWQASRGEAAKLGLRLRPLAAETAMAEAHRVLSSRRLSDGFSDLAAKGRLDLSLEALAVDKRFTALFSDQEANEALSRLLDSGYRF